jgi:hypothetical protein
MSVISSWLARFLKRLGRPNHQLEAAQGMLAYLKPLRGRMAKSGELTLDGVMRTIVLLMLVAASSASAALADPAGRPKLDFATPPSKVLPLKGASNSCAAYGAGFTKVEGTDTCVKVGGSVRVDASGGAGTR